MTEENHSWDTDMRLVHVRWIDARGAHSEWQELEDLREGRPCLCISVGYVLADDKERMHIVPHLCDRPKQGCGDMVIPKSAIIKITDLAPLGPPEIEGRLAP